MCSSDLRWIRRWERLRPRVFGPAPWFHEPTIVNPALVLDKEVVLLSLTQTWQRLEALMAAAESEMNRFGEERVTLANLAEPGNRDRLQLWRSWAESWVSRVDEAAAALPDPRQVPEELYDGYELTVRVVDGLSVAPNPGPGVFLSASDPQFNALYLPDKYQRDVWIGNLRNWLEQARELLKR